jgi:hypothetical protein
MAARRKAALQAQAAAAAAAGGGGASGSGGGSGGGGGGGGGSASRRKNSRERRESDVMVPWADVNADITCEHGGLRPLASRQGSNGGGGGGGNGGSLSLSGSGSGSGGGSIGGLIMGKRRLVDKRAWKVGQLRGWWLGRCVGCVCVGEGGRGGWSDWVVAMDGVTGFDWLTGGWMSRYADWVD